jgi:predicted negative regulator of RcsB-dependent stress response
VSDYLTEQQQIEQLKEWWKKHGTTAVTLVLAIFLIGVGWHFWLKHRENKLQRASTHYEELLNAVANDDSASVLKEANLLKGNYSHTPYAALASLMIARNAVYQNNYTAAEKELLWVAKHASGHSLKQVANLRLARLYLQEGKPDASLLLLEKTIDVAYLPLINELKGDSYAALHQADNARMAYQAALNVLPAYALMRPILVMKLNNLPSGSK